MAYNAKSQRNLVAMEKLGPDEETAVYRVRASKAVHQWLREMGSAEERGRVLGAFMEQERGFKQSPQSVSAGCSEQVQVGEQQEAKVLRVVERQITSEMKRKLKRSKDWYAQVEALLAQGDRLTPRGRDYVTEQGEAVTHRQVEAWLRVGLVSE